MAKVIMVDDLIEQMDNFKSQKDVAKFIKKYKSVEYLPMIMMNYADELRNKSKCDIANLIYLEMVENKHLKYIYDEVTLYLRLGEYYINNGEIEKGKSYLISLCDEVDNYEEAIEFRELTAEWQKLKAYVIDEIKPSLVTMNDTDEDEFVPDDELLELLLSEMGSGGIHAYLTSYGHLLERTLEMARSKEKPITVELLELIKTKYFKGEMPEKLSAIENIIDKNDWWFEEEFDQYYYKIEKELC